MDYYDPLDPESAKPLCLKRDEGKSEDTRPTFLWRNFTARQYRAQRAAVAKARTADSLDGVHAALIEAIRPGLVGWRNITTRDPETAQLFGVGVGEPLLFKPELIDAVVDHDALWEIANHFPQHIRLDDPTKKASPSSQPETQGSSAPTALGAGAVSGQP